MPTAFFDHHQRVDEPVSYAIGFWTRRDGCAQAPTREKKGSVRHEAYACADGTAVELYAVEGQGHAWPGGASRLRADSPDAPTTDISATDLMWDFFARHPKP